MSGTPIICLTDLDCPGSEVCYTNVSWFNPQAYAAPNGCLCSTWFGWTGPNCSELTHTGKWWLATSILIAACSFVGLLLAIVNALRLARAGRFSPLSDATTTANWQIAVGFMCQFINQVMNGVESTQPGLSSTLVDKVGDKIANTKTGREIVFITGCCATIVAAMTTALAWVEIAERARRLTTKAQATVIPMTRKLVVVFEVTLICTMVSLSAVQLPNLAVVTGLVGAFIVMVAYLVGFCKMRAELMNISSVAANEQNKEIYRKVIRELTWTLSGVLFGMLIVVITGILILFYSFSNWKESCLPEAIPAIIVAWQLLPLALMIAQAFLLNALRRATARRINQTKSKSSDYAASGNARVGAAEKHADTKESTVTPILSDAASPKAKNKELPLAAYQESNSV